MTSDPHIAILCNTPSREAEAKKLSTQWQWPLIENEKNIPFDFWLVFTPDYLEIRGKTIKPFHVDFLSPQLRYRSQQASSRKEALARAIGKLPRDQPTIVDATAGWGRDSFMLSSLGYCVTMIEKSPVVHALLADGLQRARLKLPEKIARLKLIQGNAIEWLTHNEADVVYLDPLFPEKKKTASAKKEMIILRQLVGVEPHDNDSLLKAALGCALYRVVVKRPRLASPIGMQKPHFSLTGKSSRFDIYSLA